MCDILRVFLCGAHSTGKTTLLGEVKPLLQLQAYTNVARSVLENSGLDRHKIDHQSYPDEFQKLQELIIKKLLDVDNESVQSNHDYICDRGVDPLVYTYLYLGEEKGKAVEELSFVQEFINRLRDSLLFVVLPHAECLADDGVRMRPEMSELQAFTKLMVSLLDRLKIPYKVIEDLDLQKRRKQVVDEVLARKPELSSR